MFKKKDTTIRDRVAGLLEERIDEAQAEYDIEVAKEEEVLAQEIERLQGIHDSKVRDIATEKANKVFAPLSK